MDYLLDRYIFAYLPFQISDNLKKSISSSSMSAVKIADWFCKTQDLWNFFENHFTFLAVEILYLFLFVFTLIHAIRLGGRYIYTWLGITMLIFLQESLQLWVPIFNIQWNAQGLLSFCGGRIPISRVLGARHVFIYSSYVFSERLQLPFSRDHATAILALIIKLPYDFIGTYFLWWTWDFNNPLTQEKIYGVPWIVFVFDLILINIFSYALKPSRKFLVKDIYNWKMFVREFGSVAFSAVFALGGLIFTTCIINYIGIYSPVSTKIIFIVNIFQFAIRTYFADRSNKNPKTRSFNPYWFDELSFAVCIHFIMLMLLVVFYNPIYVVSRGFHQPIGPCEEKTSLDLLPFASVNFF